jgi:hypothetical protein
MIKVVVKPNSEKADGKWIPAGLIIFPSGSAQSEQAERCNESKFDTKEEADLYFIQASNKKYKI